MPLNGMRSLQRKIERMETKLDRKPQDAIEREAGRITSNMRANVAFNDAIASSELLNGITYRPHDSGVVIASDAPYSGFVEFGTGPRHVYNPYTRRYSAPDFSGSLVESLRQWAYVKPTLTLASIKFNSYESFAWAVARNISGESDDAIPGTDPQPFFFPAWESGKQRLINSVEIAVEGAVKYS